MRLEENYIIFGVGESLKLISFNRRVDRLLTSPIIHRFERESELNGPLTSDHCTYLISRGW